MILLRLFLLALALALPTATSPLPSNRGGIDSEYAKAVERNAGSSVTGSDGSHIRRAIPWKFVAPSVIGGALVDHLFFHQSTAPPPTSGGYAQQSTQASPNSIAQPVSSFRRTSKPAFSDTTRDASFSTLSNAGKKRGGAEEAAAAAQAAKALEQQVARVGGESGEITLGGGTESKPSAINKIKTGLASVPWGGIAMGTAGGALVDHYILPIIGFRRRMHEIEAAPGVQCTTAPCSTRY
ncbi:hypothetical protein V8E36_006633 [Tilletia maclaganii]